MNCREALDWLQCRLDGDMLPAPSGLEQHLAGCPFCRPQHQTGQLLLEGLQSLKHPVPPDNLSDLIVARVLADRRSRSIRWRRRVATTAALAASLLLAALAGHLWLPTSKNDGLDKAAARQKAPQRRDSSEVVAAGLAAGPSLTRSVEEARLAVASLTEKIADKGKEQARLWWSAAARDVPRQLPGMNGEQPLDPAARSLRQTGQGASEGLQTVAQSARRAVSYFFRELPPLEMPKSGT
jgi:predicted anti-sigma-YlaC factor YlaD